MEMCEEKFKNEGAHIQCPVNFGIDIRFANYGRTRPYSEVCHANNDIENIACFTDASKLNYIYSSCQAKRSCHITRAELNPGDPCWGVEKYFEIKYYCLSSGKTHV